MKKLYPLKIILFFITVIFSFSNKIYGQEKTNSIVDLLNNDNPYEEVIYGHLNKTTYIKGESLGFTIYSLDKKKKKLSTITSNLYCVIYDSSNKIVKEKLLKVENGITSNSFILDNTFKSGTYVFKAYTNWMLNFSSQNFFTDSFKVINPDENKFTQRIKRSDKLDIQILPESGHLLTNVINTMGVIIKDSLGYGFPNLEGKIVDDKNDLITSFKVNKYGIGRFSFIPKKNKSYRAIIDKNGVIKEIKFAKKKKENGIILKVNSTVNSVLISAVTNKKTLNSISNKTYKILFFEDEKLNSIQFSFKNKTEVTKKIPFSSLANGISIFTLMNQENQPIAERMFFNYSKLKINKLKELFINSKNDSIINTSLVFEKKVDEFNNFSVSILPKGTKSYNKNSNIIADFLIKPYIKGEIEDSGYYFTDIDNNKKNDLDNLLITQGWSSYDWKYMFNKEKNYKYNFEKGIQIKVNLQNKKNNLGNTFSLFSTSQGFLNFFNLDKGKTSFMIEDYFPTDKDNLFISEIKKRGKLKPQPLYAQFFPTKVPHTNKFATYLTPKNRHFIEDDYSEMALFKTINNNNILKEVVVKTNLEREKIENIKRGTAGRIYKIKNNHRFLTLAQYITFNIPRFTAKDTNEGDLLIGLRSINTSLLGNSNAVTSPLVFLDNFQVTNKQLLYNYFLDEVDYIEVRPAGIAKNGALAPYGIIRIKTDPFKYKANKKVNATKIEVPLIFSNPKKFYVPKYKSYSSSFFKNYGVINWLPINKIDKNGNANFEVNNLKQKNITIYIEGITKSGEFIFEQKDLKIN